MYKWIENRFTNLSRKRDELDISITMLVLGMFHIPAARGEKYNENLAEIARELIRMGTFYLLNKQEDMNKATVEAIKTGLDAIESTDPNYVRSDWDDSPNI